MELFIPQTLREQLPNFAEKGEQWLADLPGRVAELERSWGITVGPTLDHGGCVSWIAPARLNDGTDAILKIGIPHDEARYEADALRFYNGEGFVRLLNVSDDGFALLLERCLPGTDLWSLTEEDRDTVAIDLLAQLRRTPDHTAPFTLLNDLVAAWWDDLPKLTAAGPYHEDEVADVVALGKELAATQPEQVLLHGDFHPGNVLAAQRTPFLIIDPKPVVGDPAYDIAQWLYNARTPDATLPAFRRKIERFAEALALDPLRIAGWVYVKSFGWECGAENFHFFRKLKETW